MPDQKQEVVAKIARLVAEEFKGDYRLAFSFYDSNQDNRISKDELTRLLVDADIGSRLTRWAYIRGIVDALDTDNDGHISYREFADAVGQ